MKKRAPCLHCFGGIGKQVASLHLVSHFHISFLLSIAHPDIIAVRMSILVRNERAIDLEDGIPAGEKVSASAPEQPTNIEDIAQEVTIRKVAPLVIVLTGATFVTVSILISKSLKYFRPLPDVHRRSLYKPWSLSFPPSPRI